MGVTTNSSRKFMGKCGLIRMQHHLINLETCEITRPQFQGTPPEPRSTPMICANGQSIFIWGGYNGKFPNELAMLDLPTQTWHSVETEINGRTSFPFSVVGDYCYITCGSRVPGMLRLDMENSVLAQSQPIGDQPTHDTMNSSMISAGSLLISIGGKGKSPFTYVYSYSINRDIWQHFYIIPDHDSVSVVDGQVEKDGIFQIPRNHSLGLVYRKRDRTVYGFLGFPCQEPPPIFTLQVDEAIGFANLTDDMIDAFRFSSKMESN